MLRPVDAITGSKSLLGDGRVDKVRGSCTPALAEDVDIIWCWEKRFWDADFVEDLRHRQPQEDS
jgi:hypothetical protein